MKVILVNGSPNKKGCTYTALTYVEETLKDAGIETEMVSPKLLPDYTRKVNG